MTPKQLFVSFLLAFLYGILTAYLAKGRGRSSSLWFCIGLFLGIFGPLVLFIFPKIESKPYGEEVSIEPSPPEPVTQWFYLDEMHVQKGPVTPVEFGELYKNQVITDTTYVWSEGMQQWKRVAEVPRLFEKLQNQGSDYSK